MSLVITFYPFKGASLAKMWSYDTHVGTFAIKASGECYVLLHSDDFDKDAFLLHGESPEDLITSLVAGNVPDIVYNRSVVIQDTSKLGIPSDLDK